MNAYYSTIQTHPVAYITRDIERALGLGLHVPGLLIISNKTSFAKRIAKEATHTRIILIENNELLDTWQLLDHPTTTDALHTHNITNIAVFKPTRTIERLAETKGLTLLNPAASLSNTVEEKISQVAWLGDLAAFLPQHMILLCKEVAWNFEPFVLQFNRAHTGSGTLLIESKEQLLHIQKKFPDRPVRVSAFIEGMMCTNNNVVTDTNILIGNISYQITGMAPFSTNPFATVGNDWGVIPQILPYNAQSQFKEIAHAVGLRLKQEGWKGAFGIDAIYEKNTQNVFLIEINARQPASVSFESILQEKARTKKQEYLYTTAEAHMAALLGVSLRGAKLVPIEDGAQVILRNPITKKHREHTMQQLEKLHLNCIPYEKNTAAGSDALRIQHTSSLLHDATTWNDTGNAIAHIITSL